MTRVNAAVAHARQRFWATELPWLHPGMLVARGASASPFPFSDPNVEYVHFARNAIYVLAQQLGLVGADVLMPAYFHGVELEALLAAGVRPRFFPVHGGMCVDPEDIRQLIRAETRAIYLTHYVGFPGPVKALRALCDERGLVLIEDCALALLSRLGDEWLGSFGDAAVFCLYKTLPTPDGGAAVVRHGRLRFEGVTPRLSGTVRETAAALLQGVELNGGGLGLLARSARAVGRTLSRPAHSNWIDVGTQHFQPGDVRLAMSPISQRIVAAQDFEHIVQTRRSNYLHLEYLLRDLSPPVFPGLPEGVCPLFYAFATTRKRELWTKLRASGVQTVMFWNPSGLGPAPGEFPEVDALRRTVLELPCHQDMTPQRIERVAHAVRVALRELGE
jgi:dTDP-4-amino-4,6-dideoxygalactose transaminase